VIAGDMLYLGAWFGEASLRDELPDWKTMLAKYDKDGDGFISKAEFPDDLALVRRIDAGTTPGAVVKYKLIFDGTLDTNHDGKLSAEEWARLTSGPAPSTGAPGTSAIRLGGNGDMTAKSVLWSEDRAVPEVPAPLAYIGRVYTVTNGGIVTVLDAVSGKLIYRARLGAGGLYYASPVAAGGRVYFGSGEGVVTVIDAAADRINVLAHNDLGEPIFATPAIVEGRIYIRTASHLYAFGN
jgi:outer membrane protein assembly factor BamB